LTDERQNAGLVGCFSLVRILCFVAIMATAPTRAAELSRSGYRLRGWPIVGWAALSLHLMVAVTLLVWGVGEDGVRAVIRYTARTSFALFTLAFVASALHRLRHSSFSRWLLTNRRYVGVSFAVSHGLHLVAILVLARISAAFVAELEAGTIIGGGLGFVFVGLLAATSFDVSAAWLGPRWWRRLHLTGLYYLWFIFFVSYLPRALQDVLYAPFVVVLLAGVAARIAASRRRSATAATAAIR
jgi:DMSO/TMAO reductase YedYZ heme-binding membrane subunit